MGQITQPSGGGGGSPFASDIVVDNSSAAPITVGQGGGNAGAKVSSTVLGANALANNVSGSQNVAIGAIALLQNRAGERSTAIGYSAAQANVCAENVTAIGFGALASLQSPYALITAVTNSGGGVSRFATANTTSLGIGIGVTIVSSLHYDGAYVISGINPGAWFEITTAFLGNDTGAWVNPLTSDNNVAVGNSAGGANTGGMQNTYVGAQVHGKPENGCTYLGYGATPSAADNAIVLASGSGVHASYDDITGIWTFTGNSSFKAGAVIDSQYIGTRGDTYNLAIGNGANSSNNTFGTQNVAIGYHAMHTAVTDSTNVAVGFQAMLAANGANENVAVGHDALVQTVTGQQNVAVGRYTGFNSTGSMNTYVGYKAGYNQYGQNNTTYIGGYLGLAGEHDSVFLSAGTTLKFSVNNLNLSQTAGNVATPVIGKGNSGTAAQTYDVSASGEQTCTATGNHTVAFSNWPVTGNETYLHLTYTNAGAFTITWPTINWIKPDGTTTTSIAAYLAANTGRTALQAAGMDQFLFWSGDAGTTVYGKLI